MRNLILAFCGLAIFAATPAFADTCVRQNDIYNWTAVNEKTIILENYRHQKVTLKLMGTCSGLKFHQTLVIRSPGITGLSCVQRGDTIITRGFGWSGTCAVVSVTPYTTGVENKPVAAAPTHPSY